MNLVKQIALNIHLLASVIDLKINEIKIEVYK